MANWSKRPDDIIACGRGKLRKLLPCGVWHFRHHAGDGKWRYKSTGHRDRKGAVAWAEAFSMQLTREEFTGTPGTGSPAVPTPLAATAPTVLRALALWLRYQRQQNRPNTGKSYRSIARKFWRFLKLLGIRQLIQIDRALMMKFRGHCLRKLSNSKVTVDNNLIALRSFFSWAGSKGWLTGNPASQTRHGEKIFFDEAAVRKETYTRAEYDRILAASNGDAQRVFTLLASWGLRISELAMLEWSDIDHVGAWVHIRNKVTHDGITYRPKDKTDRKLPLEGEPVALALDYFAEQTGRTGYVVPLARARSRPDVAERKFIKRLQALSGTVGIPRERLTLHRFRHFFVCECADHGVPLATVMDWVGHDEIKMVMYYYSLRDTSAREAMRRLNHPSPPPAAPPQLGSPSTNDPRASGESDGRN
jgi:integrase